MINASIAELLNEKYEQFNRPNFIKDDPISIPHQFSLKQDIEIMAFFAATLAWGQRKTIIQKCKELAQGFDNAPFQFISQHQESDLKRFLSFKHRTFNEIDTLYFIEFFTEFYRKHESLESAFLNGMTPESPNIKEGLINFQQLFFSLENSPKRTQKHIATPARNSACKRLNMFLRWMVRNDDRGVDFGLWKNIQPSQLICPLDVHVERVARKLNLISRPKADWKTAEELTDNLKLLDAADPIKYDFALFGLGVERYF